MHLRFNSRRPTLFSSKNIDYNRIKAGTSTGSAFFIGFFMECATGSEASISYCRFSNFSAAGSALSNFGGTIFATEATIAVDHSSFYYSSAGSEGTYGIFGPGGVNIPPTSDYSPSQSTENLWMQFVSPTNSDLFWTPVSVQIAIILQYHMP